MDSIVIYLSSANGEKIPPSRIQTLVNTIAGAFSADDFRDEVPASMERVARGIGYSDRHYKESSHGYSRSTPLAKAFVHRDSATPDGFHKRLNKEMFEHRINPYKPYLSLKIGSAPLGGNSFFHSVIAVLKREGLTYFINNLRSMTAQEIKRNFTKYEKLFRGNNALANISANFILGDGNWDNITNNVVPVALAHALNRTIIILNQKFIMLNSFGKRYKNNNPIIIFYNGQGHYDPSI